MTFALTSGYVPNIILYFLLSVLETNVDSKAYGFSAGL
jgi:hypothetical protein